MAGFTKANNADNAASKISDLTVGQAVSGIAAIINPFAWIAVAEAENQKNDIKNYLDRIDILDEYNTTLLEIEGQKVAQQNTIFYYQGLIQDLNRDKAESEEYLEDYRQMLAGEGDDDNLLLQQDRLNQANVDNAENTLAAYRDSSALELDSLIQSGFSQYTSQRNQQAIENIYASASGSIVGAYNSAARRTMASIRAFVGDDMRFNEEAEGTSVQRTADDSFIGSYAKLMLSNRTIVRNNIAQYQSNVDAAKLAYDSFRDEAEDAAEENQLFLDDYDRTLANYQMNISYANSYISHLQSQAQTTLDKGNELIKEVNAIEEKYEWEQSQWNW